MVAVGNLDKIWIEIPDDASESDFTKAFLSYFNEDWSEVLDTADKAFSYNAANNAYFAVRNLHPVEDLTLDQLLEKEGTGKPANIIVS